MNKELRQRIDRLDVRVVELERSTGIVRPEYAETLKNVVLMLLDHLDLELEALDISSRTKLVKRDK